MRQLRVQRDKLQRRIEKQQRKIDELEKQGTLMQHEKTRTSDDRRAMGEKDMTIKHIETYTQNPQNQYQLRKNKLS